MGYTGTGTTSYIVGSGRDVQLLTNAAYTGGQGTAIEQGNGFIRYKNSLAKLTTTTLNVFSRFYTDSTLSILGTLAKGAFQGGAAAHGAVYEMTGTNQEDDADAFIGLMVGSAIISNTDSYTLAVQGTVVNTLKNYIGFTTAIGLMVIPANTTVGATAARFTLAHTNPHSQDLKIGFGLTGGTYVTPTGATLNSTINLTLQ